MARTARIIVIALPLALVLALGSAPKPASADASGLCRAFTMIAFAPTDLVLGPMIAAHDLVYGLSSQGDPLMLQVVATGPAYLWLLSLQAGGSVIRVASGIYEIIPGIFTLFEDGPSTPLNRSVDEAWSLYSEDFGPCPVRVGVSYQTINEN